MMAKTATIPLAIMLTVLMLSHLTPPITAFSSSSPKRVVPRKASPTAPSLLTKRCSSSSCRREHLDASSQLFASSPGDSSLSSSADSSSVVTIERIGDDAANFSWEEQKLSDWIKFTFATGTVLAAVAWVWIFGPLHGGDVFIETVQSTLQTTDPAATVAGLLTVFGIAHSGLAGLRTYAEPVVGARAWRVLFAVVSLPLALSCISYFVNHAHEGATLWQLPSDPESAALIHAALWCTNFVSFLFLYPSTFNLLEIAAIQPPQLHLYAPTGIIRITRHPQAVGQVLWCVAHTAYLGTSTALAASTILMLHHAFAVYHGDRRLQTRHGEEAFNFIANQTSVWPFLAILEGRQPLPPDYYKEFLRLPYLVVVVGTVAAYYAHPYMQAGAALLHW